MTYKKIRIVHNATQIFRIFIFLFLLNLQPVFALFESSSVDVFADYLYQLVRFDKHVDIGGFKTGFGVGYQF